VVAPFKLVYRFKTCCLLVGLIVLLHRQGCSVALDGDVREPKEPNKNSPDVEEYCQQQITPCQKLEIGLTPVSFSKLFVLFFLVLFP
jgi:hypothetical protein